MSGMEGSNIKKKSLWRLKRTYVLLVFVAFCTYTCSNFNVSKLVQKRFDPVGATQSRHKTKTDVIGDLGGLKVKIPYYYAEYVEYDGDPSFGNEQGFVVPERTYDSRLNSFGIEARFPSMKGLDSQSTIKEYKSYWLNPDNPWVRISILAGEAYPGLGERARDGLAKGLGQPSKFWFDNFERLPDTMFGLEAYVPVGNEPKTGKPARLSDLTKDIFIFKDATGHVDTYISCGRTSVPRGIVPCKMDFGLEPDAKVAVSVSFYPKLLKDWNAIKQASKRLLLSFKVDSSSSEKSR